MKLRPTAITAAMFMLATACGGGNSGASASPGGPVAIEFASTVSDATTGWPANLNAITIEYAKTHPGSTFKNTYVPQADLNQKIQLLAAQNALPIMYNADLGLIKQLDASGQVLDLESTFKSLGVYDQLSPAAVAVVKRLNNGKLLGLPFELNMEGFWYNKKIFADNGLTAPTTWDDMVSDAAKLKAKGIQPFSASGIQGWPITRLIGNYIFRKLGPDAMDKVASGSAKLTDPAYVEAATAVANLGSKGYFGPGVAALDYDPAVDVFLSGKAAMFYMGSWELRDFNDSVRNKIGADNVGYFPFPTVSGGVGTADQIGVNAGLLTYISKKKYNDSVGQWLAYMAKNYGDTAIARQGAVTGFAVHNPPATTPALTNFVTTQISKVSTPVLWFEANFGAKAQDASQKNAALLVTGAMSPQTFMSTVQAAQ